MSDIAKEYFEHISFAKYRPNENEQQFGL